MGRDRTGDDGPFDVVVVGSANVDLVATTSRLPRPGETVLGTTFTEHAGGKGLNQAVAAARAGARVAFIGSIGGDAAGDMLAAVVAAEGIDAAGLDRIDGTPTGRAIIAVSDDGENSIIVISGANALGPPPTTLPPGRLLLLQLETPMAVNIAAVRLAREAAMTTVLNPAPAPLESLPDELLADIDVIVPNEHEVELLGGPGRLLAAGVGAVVVTLGARGARLHRRDGVSDVAPTAVVAIDTTGAGDAFCGNLAARLAAGDDLPAALAWAATAAALATTRRGAVAAMPTAAETMKEQP